MTPHPRQKGALPIYMRYCMVFLLVQLAAVVASTLLWERVVERFYGQLLRSSVSEVHQEVSQRLLAVPAGQWPALVRELGQTHDAEIWIEAKDDALGALPDEQGRALVDGGIVLSEDGAASQRRLGDGQHVLGVRSAHAAGALLILEWASWTVVLFTLLIAIAAPLYFLVHRLWHDARVLGQGAGRIPQSPMRPMVYPSRCCRAQRARPI